MKKYIYPLTEETRIKELEDSVFSHYQELVQEFDECLSNLRCHVVLERCWTINSGDRGTIPRPIDYRSYIYWISYTIVDENGPVIWDDENSCLEASFGVISVKRKKKKGHEVFDVRYVDDMEDVREDILENIRILKNLKT